jgi:hypothetical protein
MEGRRVVTKEQVKWAMTHEWYREYQEIVVNITPTYKVRVSDGMLKWFSDYNELLSWVSQLENTK